MITAIILSLEEIKRYRAMRKICKNCSYFLEHADSGYCLLRDTEVLIVDICTKFKNYERVSGQVKRQ